MGERVVFSCSIGLGWFDDEVVSSRWQVPWESMHVWQGPCPPLSCSLMGIREPSSSIFNTYRIGVAVSQCRLRLGLNSFMSPSGTLSALCIEAHTVYRNRPCTENHMGLPPTSNFDLASAAPATIR